MVLRCVARLITRYLLLTSWSIRSDLQGRLCRPLLILKISLAATLTCYEYYLYNVCREGGDIDLQLSPFGLRHFGQLRRLTSSLCFYLSSTFTPGRCSFADCRSPRRRRLHKRQREDTAKTSSDTTPHRRKRGCGRGRGGQAGGLLRQHQYNKRENARISPLVSEKSWYWRRHMWKESWRPWAIWRKRRESETEKCFLLEVCWQRERKRP